MKNYSDSMTSRERIKALILNQPYDRVPFMPFALGYFALSNTVSLYDFFTRPEVAFRVAQSTAKQHPWANIRPVYAWADHGAWEFGGDIAWPDSDVRMTPYTPKPRISQPEEVDSLPEPEPVKTEWFRLLSHFNELCVQNGFSALLPSASIMSPMGSIVGAARLMKWMKRYPDAVHLLAEKVLRFNVKAAEIIFEKYGSRNCSVSTELPMESNTVISPGMFEEFCLPYIARLHGFYLENGVRGTMIHLCGDHRGNLQYWKQIPLPKRTIFSIGDDMDLEETGDFLGETYILAGNISTHAIQFGSKEAIMEEVKRCLHQAKDRSGGFILMPACEYPPMAPPESLEAIREGLMRYGQY